MTTIAGGTGTLTDHQVNSIVAAGKPDTVQALKDVDLLLDAAEHDGASVMGALAAVRHFEKVAARDFTVRYKLGIR